MIALRVFCLSISSICQFTIDSSSLFLHFFRWRPCVCRQHSLAEMFDASTLKCRATDANCLSFCSSSALPTLKCWILRLFSRFSAHWLNCFFLLFLPFWLPFYTLCSNFFPFFPLHSASFCLFLFFSFFHMNWRPPDICVTLGAQYFFTDVAAASNPPSFTLLLLSMSSFLFDYTHIHRNWHSNWSIIEFFTVLSSSSSRLLNAMMMAVVVVVHISYSGSVSFVCGFVVHLLTFSRLASNNCWTQ